jgi:hypothetical protein
MSEVKRYSNRQENAVESMGHYWVEVYKNGMFYEHIEYLYFSGTAVHDEVKWLKREYPASEGYEVRW